MQTSYKQNTINQSSQVPFSISCMSPDETTHVIDNSRKRRVAEAREIRRRRRMMVSFTDQDGCTSEPQLVYGHVSVMGRMRVMEDAVTVAPPERLAGKYSFFAVYDGHGGSKVAEKCSRIMHKCLEKHLEEWMLDTDDEKKEIEWEKVMRTCFRCVDEEIASDTNVSVDNKMMGSTAVVVLVGKEDIVVANCGDSRAVLCRAGVAVPLSRDHKADRPDEKERVEAAGGMVLNWNGWRVQGVLAISRSLGDEYLKPYVTSEPEVRVVRRTESDEFLIVATDGLWDMVCNDTACATVRKRLNARLRRRPPSASALTSPSNAAATLAEIAMAKGSNDNISIIIVRLR